MAAVTEIRPMLTVEQVAAALAVSEATVRRLAAAGALPSVRVGRQVRFPPAWLDERVSPPTTSQEEAA